MSFRAVIFDFDGVLVDTEVAIYASWHRLFEAEGVPLPLDLFTQCVGSGYSHWNPADYLESQTGRTYDWATITARRQAEIERDLAGSGLMDGAAELLEHCKLLGLKLAVGSSSSHRWVDGWLHSLGIYDKFVAVVCRDDGYPVKPAPDIFMAAARALGVSPIECLVIEDSPNGCTAAVQAGMRVVAVPNAMTQHGDFSHATYRVDRLSKIPHLLNQNCCTGRSALQLEPQL